MDRFIAHSLSFLQFLLFSLKSNMDRFIAISVIYTLISIVTLKSNMDRFIADVVVSLSAFNATFKIQYG